MNSVLIIVPAWNEAESLPATLAELLPAATSCGADVVVIDDGSADATAQVARAGGATVLSLPFNVGVGGALRTGFRYAKAHGYQYALQVDADGQHTASSIAGLVERVRKGDASVIVGSRFSASDEYEVSAVRGSAMRGLTITLRALLGLQLTDPSSGFRAFDRRAIELFAERYPVEYLSDTVEALLIAGYAGLRVAELPVAMRQRVAGRPSNRNWRLVYHYIRLMTKVTLTARLDARQTHAHDRRTRVGDGA